MYDTPTFVTQMIAWTGAATSWAALVIGKSKDKADGAHVVVTECLQVPGGIELVLKNVGGRAALNVSAEVAGIRAGFTGGIAAKEEWRLTMASPAVTTAGIKIFFGQKASSQESPEYEIAVTPSGWALVR
jgi:hypothetical protein